MRRRGSDMTVKMTVPVSIGELVDKMVILQIKKERIKDPIKVKNVTHELVELETIYNQSKVNVAPQYLKRLKEINESLWDIEDKIRDKEREQEFDNRFIELARAVYITNDQRFEVKNTINKEFGSDLVEEKSYKPY